MPFSPQNVPNGDEPLSEEDGFELIDINDILKDIDATQSSAPPWFSPEHPLFFPSTREFAEHHTTRWAALNTFSVENWYSELEALTFKSTFITIHHDDILYLMCNPPESYDPSILVGKLNRALATFNNQSAFIRLSTRSPKDSKSLYEDAATIMSQDRTYWPETQNPHQQLISFITSMIQSMKVSSGKQIVDMIQGSPRIFNDLISLISQGEISSHSTQIILREWIDIRPDHEFRIFVSRRGRTDTIVTAICQYFHFLFFDDSPSDNIRTYTDEEQKELKDKLTNYILRQVDSSVAKILKYAKRQDRDFSNSCIREYIADLALIPEEEYKGEVNTDNTITIRDKTFIIMLIELNPFAPSATSSSLFNWHDDLDLLWGQTDSPSTIYKIRTSPREDLDSVTLLPKDYKDVLKAATEKRMMLEAPKPIVSDAKEKPPIALSPFFDFAGAASSCPKKEHLDEKTSESTLSIT